MRRVSRKSAILVAAAGSSIVLLVGVSANVALLRDALAVVVALALVVLFFGVRLVASRLRDPADREFELWGGMTETTDKLVDRYRRPGANPILPPGDTHWTEGLPDADPVYGGHSIGEDPTARTN